MCSFCFIQSSNTMIRTAINRDLRSFHAKKKQWHRIHWHCIGNKRQISSLHHFIIKDLNYLQHFHCGSVLRLGSGIKPGESCFHWLLRQIWLLTFVSVSSVSQSACWVRETFASQTSGTLVSEWPGTRCLLLCRDTDSSTRLKVSWRHINIQRNQSTLLIHSHCFCRAEKLQ